MRARILVLLAATALLTVPALSAVAAPGPALPQVTVRIDEVEPVDVDRDTATTIEVNGTINVTMPLPVPVDVALNVTVVPSFWPATITPMRGNLTGSGDVPFTVTVEVPARAGAGDGTSIEVVANVSAYGVGRDFFGQEPIPVIQYYDLVLFPDVPNAQQAAFDASLGADTAFSFRLKNEGNGADTFEVRVANAAQLQGAGITTDLSSPITNVGTGVTVVVSGSVHLSSTVSLGSHTLSIEALSSGAVSDGKEAVASTNKTIRAVEAPPGPDPGPGPGDGGDNGSNGSGGFLPAPGAVAAVGALGATALVAAAWRRARRP